MNKSGEGLRPTRRFTTPAFEGGQSGADPAGPFANRAGEVGQGGAGRFHTGEAWAQVETKDVPVTVNNAIELYRQNRINISQASKALGITPLELERGIKAGDY